MRYALILAFYILGQMLLVISTAFIASKSKLNGIYGLWDYFKLRWPPLVLRWFISLCLFFLVWNNPKLIDLEGWLPNYAAHVGAAGILGWVSDSILDKVLTLIFPNVQKELPPIPDPSVDTGKP